MNDRDLDLLVRSSLERDAATQPVSSDLHERSVSYGKRVVLRRRVAGVCTTVAVVAAAALISVSVGGGRKTAPTAPPVPTLTSVVSHVQTLPAEPLPTTGFWYVALRAPLQGKPATGAVWLRPDGTAREELGGLEVETPASSGQVILPWAVVASLPTEPADLMAWLRHAVMSVPAYTNTDAVVSLMEVTGALLGEAPTSPPLRAALIEGLGETTGVRVAGTATDLVGETGLALTHSVDGATYTVLVSPSTGRALQVDYTSPSEHDSETFLHQAAVPDDRTVASSGAYVAPTPPRSTRRGVSLAFQTAVDQQTSGVAGSGQLDMPSDVAGVFVEDHQTVLPDGTELAIGHFSGVAVPVSDWLSGTGAAVLEDGLGDSVKGAPGVTEYVLHDAQHQAGAAPWQWVVVVGRPGTTKVETAPSAAGPWATVSVTDGLLAIPVDALQGATSRVRLYAGSGRPYFTGHLAVLPVHRYGS